MAERDREIGRRTHALVARFCRQGAAPEPTQVWIATGLMFGSSPMVLNQSSRQRAACAVSSYFLRFHQSDWRFVGAEVELGSGRVDLVWELPSHQLIIDELKTGALSDAIEDRRTLEQLGRYTEAGRSAWGNEFVGVRLLPLTCPGRARFYANGTVGVPLGDAPKEVR